MSSIGGSADEPMVREGDTDIWTVNSTLADLIFEKSNELSTHEFFIWGMIYLLKYFFDCTKQFNYILIGSNGI